MSSEIPSTRHLTQVPRNNRTGWPAWNLALSPYGQHWRDIRKLGQQSMKKGDIAQYQPVQAARAAELLKNILDTPQDFLRHVRT